jgi:hypothetical protein
MNLKKVIYIAGVARSGTSWLGQVFNSSPDVTFRFQPLFAYEFKNAVNEDSSAADFSQLFEQMVLNDSSFLVQEDKVLSGTYPDFEKNSTNSILAFKENRYQSVIEPMMRKVPYLYGVGLIRHPCAVLSSWMRNEKEFPKGADIEKEWRFGNCKNQGNEDYFGFYKWKEVANLYLDLAEKYPDRFIVQYYEGLLVDTNNKMQDLFKFVGLPWQSNTRDFVVDSGASHSDDYYSVYKNPVLLASQPWREHLPANIVDEIYADLKGTRLARFLE